MATATVNNNGFTITKFRDEDQLHVTGDNFNPWMKLLKILFLAHGLFTIVTGDEAKPNNDDAGYKDWVNRDARALAMMGINIEMSLMADLPIESSSEMWNAILARFTSTDPLARSLALSELRNKKITGDTPIKLQLAELRSLRADYINSGGALSETEWHNIIIESLTGIWSQFVILGNSITDPEKLINSLKSEEKRKILIGDMKPFTTAMNNADSSQPISGTESALIATTGTKMKNMRVCANCEQPGHSKARCYAPGGGKESEAPDWYREKHSTSNKATHAASANFAAAGVRHEAY